MTIYCAVYPAGGTAEMTKSQVEAMYQIGLSDPDFRQLDDVEKYGLDEECLARGEIRMRHGIGKLRPHVDELYRRLTPEQQVSFQLSYLASAVRYVRQIVANLERAGIELSPKYAKTLNELLADVIEKARSV